MNRKRGRRFFLTITTLVIPLNLAMAEPVIVTLKSSTLVERRSAKDGRFLGSISVPKAVSADTDGEVIAVLTANDSIYRYWAKDGTFIGIISDVDHGMGPVTNVKVSGGVILVTTERMLYRYEAKTGRFLGSKSL